MLDVPLTPHQEKILPFTHRQYGIQHLVKVTLSSGTVGWGEGSCEFLFAIRYTPAIPPFRWTLLICCCVPDCHRPQRTLA